MTENSDYKILIIDDEESIIEATKLMLELEGYQVAFEDETPSIELVLQHRPDLIFLDLWLTQTDGRKFGQVLKNNSHTKNIPILFFSASKDVAKHAQEAQADDYIAKPFEMDLLLAKVNLLLKPKIS